MIDFEWVPKELHKLLLENLQGNDDKVNIPPPVFTKMEGKIVNYNIDIGYLEIMFPIKEEYSNPYGYMQGGMIA